MPRPSSAIVSLLLGLFLLTGAGLANPTAARAAVAADPAALTTSYDLAVRLNYSGHRLSAVETITVTNNGAPFDTLNLSFLPRYLVSLGRSTYAASFGTITADGVAVTYSWTYLTNLALSLGQTIATGQTVVLRVPFALNVGVSYDAFGARLSHRNGILSLGNWFPIISRAHLIRNIGDPQVTWTAAAIRVDITLADSYRHSLPYHAVAASGDLIATRRNSAGRVNGWVFRATNVRDFAIAVSPAFYRHACSGAVGNAAGTTVKAYALSWSLCVTLRANAIAAVHQYEISYGPYPYRTLSVAQSGNNGSSMEYPTLVFMGSNMITGTYGRYTTWHEVAHQWFYGLLGNDQLTDPWVDEAWATFSGRYFVYGTMYRYCSSADVDRSISSFADWFSCGQYYQTVYKRGANLVNDLRLAMGNDRFFAAVREYLALHRYGLVTSADFLGYLRGQSPVDIWTPALVCRYTSYC